MQPAIRVENLSKHYRLGQKVAQSYRTLREALAESARRAWAASAGRGAARPRRAAGSGR
jgi:hypothetical protein